MDDFEQHFGVTVQSGAVKRFAENSDNRAFTEEFEGGDRSIKPPGNEFGWDEVRFSRDLAPLIGPTDEAPRKKRVFLRKRTGTMLDVGVSVELPPEVLFQMRRPGSMSGNAREKIDEELEDASIQVANTVEYVCTKAAEGTVTPSTVPNSKLVSDAITFPVKTLSRSTSWAVDSTKIRSAEMNRLKDEFRKAAGFNAARCKTTKTVEGYVTQNTELAAWAQANPVIAANVLGRSFLEGGGIERMGGLEFSFTGGHYAADATPDTAVDFLTADIISVWPKESMRKEVVGMVDGISHVPAGPVFGDISSAAAAIREVRGYYAYWELKGRVLVLHVGRKFMPIVKMQNGIMAFDTV